VTLGRNDGIAGWSKVRRHYVESGVTPIV